MRAFQNQKIMKTIQILISGKVQGVWYRKSTKEKADELGIVGTVENLPTGQVKAKVQCDQQQLKELVIWMREGSKFAEVQAVETSTVLEPLQYHDFTILR